MVFTAQKIFWSLIKSDDQKKFLILENKTCKNPISFSIMFAVADRGGGAQGTRRPGPKFLHFHEVFGKICQIVGRRPPLGVGEPLWEILDSPLV